MNKYLSIIIISIFSIVFSTTKVEAKSIKVRALEPFSTERPLPNYQIQVLEQGDFGRGIILKPGTIILGDVVKINPPKRGKRNATFDFIPTITFYNGKYTRISNTIIETEIASYKPINPQKLVLSTGKKAIGFIIPGATQGISFVEGAIKAEEGEKIESGLIKIYRDSPLSYFNVGHNLNIHAGDILILKIKKSNYIR